MSQIIEKGSWVEIQAIVLSPEKRAAQVPEDTQQVPLEMKAKGYLRHTATLGQEVTIVTPVGRQLKGVLSEVNPAYTHGFGAPVPELVHIGQEVRSILQQKKR